jgi:pimeloyl-ACP methyl ester carboxylesterase
MHHAHTVDGFQLGIFRVMNDAVAAGKKAPVIFMQHGLMSCAKDWIGNTRQQAVAFQFADAGYDVWLGNNRGNQFSSGNTMHDENTDQEAYYDYSF